jgi:hypothetical protein
MLIYMLVLLVSFLGLIIGVIVSNMAIEEIDNAKKYLMNFNTLIVPTIVLIATYDINNVFSLIFSSILLILLFIIRGKYNDTWMYSCMGAIFYVSTIGKQMLTVAILIFIYGMSISTINASEHFKKKINGKVRFSENVSLLKKLLVKYGYYLLISIVFYVMFTYVL